MKNVIGTAVGAAIDRRDGDSGVKGAIAGYAASGLVKAIAKIGALAAVGYGVLSLTRRARAKSA